MRDTYSQGDGMALPKRKSCQVNGYRVVGYAWTRKKSAWMRHLVRYCESCQEPHVYQLHHVDPEYVFCLQCLSPSVEAVIEGEFIRVRCRTCKLKFSVPFESSDEVESEDERDDDDDGLHESWQG